MQLIKREKIEIYMYKTCLNSLCLQLKKILFFTVYKFFNVL